MRLVAVALPPCAPDLGEALARAPRCADLVEARLDAWPATDLAAAFARAARPVLATVRSAAQGGAFAGEPREAATRLLAAADAGAHALDVEADVWDRLAVADLRRRGVALLASAHGRGRVALSPDADAWKVARPVETPRDVGAVREEAEALAAGALRGEHPPAFVVPYGPLATHLRVVTAAVAEGAGLDPWLYGAFGARAATTVVPDLLALLDEGRAGEVSGRATLLGLLGRPPTTSPSPALHAAALRALGFDAVYLPAVDLPAAEAFTLPYAGFSVTSPRKEEAARACDRLEPDAARAGAVNTVVRAGDGALVGANTDVEAVAEAVASALAGRAPAGGEAREALVVGAGGFARAAVVALRGAGLRVRVAARARSGELAGSLGVEDAGHDVRARGGDAVLVNATPVGAVEGADGHALAFAALRAAARSTLVLDAPYAQGRRPGALADLARGRGHAVVDGLGVLLRQAVGQAARFCGRAPAADVFAVALRAKRPLVVVGPRAAGKTTVAREVARRLGRPFLDVDDDLARRVGRPAGLVLAQRGEAAFRALEEDRALAALARGPCVVALGGGALGSARVRRAVTEGAHALALGVSPPEAARRRRADPTPRPPLCEGETPEAEAERLHRERAGAYEAVAFATVATDGRAPGAVVEEVARLAADRWDRDER